MNCKYTFYRQTEMEKAASVASALVLFFLPAVLIFRLSTRKICFTIGPAVLIFGLSISVLTFGLCMHIISTASVAGTVVVCLISTDLPIFGLINQDNLWPVDKCFIQYMCVSLLKV